MRTDIERSCPKLRDDGSPCDGVLTFREEEGEDYTAHRLCTWTYYYLVMDGDTCSEGHYFAPAEVSKIEQEQTDDYQQSVYDEP